MNTRVTHFFYFFTGTGRHFCLKCHITSAQAKICPSESAAPSQPRSLQTLADDFARFSAEGGNVDKAKQYNNAVAPAFFDIPIDQVT